MWRRILTFGAEGTEAGNFCRPWGVTIARCSDFNFSDPWSFNELSTTNSLDTFEVWAGLEKHSINSNNNSINSTLSQANLTYLIGIADRSNNRIQIFKYDSILQTVSFVMMFGDGPGARHGQFDRPAGIVFNPKLEQIIVADKDNHRVQVFDMSGSYLFKFGERGSKSGQFCYPWDIDVCKTSHNIVVSDTRNRRVQMFNNLGRYLTHFNQPLDSPRGVTYILPTQLIVTDFNKHRLVCITQIEDKTVSSSTSFMQPTSDSNQIRCNQFSLSDNLPQKNTIVASGRQISNQQSYESKFVGFGEGSSRGEFLRPQGATAYGSTVFCSDSRNNRVACWDRETQNFSYISREVVELDRPAGLAAIDNHIVIVDFGNNRVHICQRVTLPSNGFGIDSHMQSNLETKTWRRVSTFGAEGTEAGNFCRPWGVTIARCSDFNFSDPWSFNELSTTNSLDTFDDWAGLEKRSIGGNININSALSHASLTYLIGIADRSNNRIQIFKYDSILQTVSFVMMFGDGPGARHGQFDRPAGIVFNPKLEQIIVADKDNHRVQVFDMSGSYLFKFGERGSKSGQFCYPWDIDVCKSSHNIVVSDTRNRRVQMFNNLGRYLTHFNQPLDSPRGVTYLSATQLIVTDFNKHRLVCINQLEDKTVSSSTSFMPPTSDSFLNCNQFNLSNNIPHKNAIVASGRQISNQQSYESKFVGFGEGSSWGEFLRPQGATAYGSTVFCSDSRNNRVACWDRETQNFSYISREVVELDRPAGLAAIDNHIVIVDFGNNRVHICQRVS